LADVSAASSSLPDMVRVRGNTSRERLVRPAPVSSRRRGKRDDTRQAPGASPFPGNRKRRFTRQRTPSPHRYLRNHQAAEGSSGHTNRFVVNLAISASHCWARINIDRAHERRGYGTAVAQVNDFIRAGQVDPRRRRGADDGAPKKTRRVRRTGSGPRGFGGWRGGRLRWSLGHSG